LKFPVEPNQIPVFEEDNPTIAIHCLAYNEENKSFYILHMSKEMHRRPHKITLLLLDSPDGQNKHYVRVKHLSRLIASKFTDKHTHHVCLSCLQPFTSQRILDDHEQNCMMHAPQQTVYPTDEKAKLSFDAHHCEFPFDFYLVAYFECFSSRSNRSLACTSRPASASIAYQHTKNFPPLPSPTRGWM